MQHQFLEFGLLLSDWKFIATILIILYLLVDKERFTIAICLQVFAISFNAYMKTVFKIPLNPEIFPIKEGWAFPSGHTQSLTSMLIYICWHYRKLWVILGSVIILIYAVISIEYFQYHTWIDIAGGVGSALLVFVSFISFVKLFKPRPNLICIVLLLLASTIHIVLFLTSNLNYAPFYYSIAGASFFVFISGIIK